VSGWRVRRVGIHWCLRLLRRRLACQRENADGGSRQSYPGSEHLDDAAGACEDLFEDHGVDCQCETCCLVSNLVGVIRMFRMLLEIT
jgi:hypothetical protein